MNSFLGDLFVCVDVGAVRIKVAAEEAIILRDRLGVSLKLRFDAGDVLVLPHTVVSEIVEDYEELIKSN